MTSALVEETWLKVLERCGIITQGGMDRALMGDQHGNVYLVDPDLGRGNPAVIDAETALDYAAHPFMLPYLSVDMGRLRADARRAADRLAKQPTGRRVLH